MDILQKIDNFLNEGKLPKDKQDRLDDLISQFSNANDPDNDDAKYNDGDKIIAKIRKEFGDKIADQVDNGSHDMHFPRKNHTSGYDKLEWRSPNRTTKDGKMNKTDAKGLKGKIMRDIFQNSSGKDKPKLP